MSKFCISNISRVLLSIYLSISSQYVLVIIISMYLCYNKINKVTSIFNIILKNLDGQRKICLAKELSHKL